MKRLSLGLALALAAACGGGEIDGASSSTPSPRPHVASAACPLKTPADWSGFVAAASTHPEWARTCSDADDCDALRPFADGVVLPIETTLAQCADDVRDNAPIAACTDRLRRFVPAWRDQHDPERYGFRLANPAYFAAQAAAGPEGMMDPPQDLLDALPTRDGLEAVARKNGWPYLVHDACLGGVRYFVLRETPSFDQWMLFGLAGDVVPMPAIFSFLAVQKRDRDGAPLARPRIHFRDYVVATAPGGTALSLPEKMPGKCHACHGSGPRQLVPFTGSVTWSSPVAGEPGFGAPSSVPFGKERLTSLNQRLAAYALPDWADTVRPDDHGPSLGASLGCPTCHDGKLRGPVTVMTSEGMLHQKLVGQLAMRALAPGRDVPDSRAMALLEREQTKEPPLTAEEAAELAQARLEHEADLATLRAERVPAVRAWLRAIPCE